VSTKQAEHSEPKTTTPKKGFIFSSKRRTENPDFTEKNNSLASTTNLHSMTSLKTLSSEEPHHIVRTRRKKTGTETVYLNGDRKIRMKWRSKDGS